MSYTPPKSVADLLAAIDAGQISPVDAQSAINQAGGSDYVELAVIRILADAGGGGGSGDVVGPASAEDTQVALYDGTTGKLIKASSIKGTSSGGFLFGSMGVFRWDTGPFGGAFVLLNAAESDYVSIVAKAVAAGNSFMEGGNIYTGGYQTAPALRMTDIYLGTNPLTFGPNNSTGTAGDTSINRAFAGVVGIPAAAYANRIITSNATMDDGSAKDSSVFGNSSSGFSFDLLTPSNFQGRELNIKNVGVGGMDVGVSNGIFSNTIISTLRLSTGDSCTLISDGMLWQITNRVITSGSATVTSGSFSLTVNDARVSNSTNIVASMSSVDATAVLGAIVPGSGSFVINMTTAPTSDTKVVYQICN